MQPWAADEDLLSLLTPRPHGGKNPLLQPGREYRGIPAGDFLFYPSVYAGGTFDDNLLSASRNRTSVFGARFAPRIEAVRDAGIHKTTIHGQIEARAYTQIDPPHAIGGKAGLAHVWEIERDFIFRTSLDFDRKASFADSGRAALPNGGFTTLTSPLYANQFKATATLQKAFGKAFVGFSAEVAKTDYDRLSTRAGPVSQHFRDSLVSSLSARAGIWFAPTMYAYSEVSGNVRDYGDSLYQSKGYRVVAGVGSDRISLFRGELYGGFQRQVYDQPLIRDAVSPVLGARIFWYPTRALTARLSVDQTFSDSSTPSLGNPNGFPGRVTSANFSLRYQMARDWSATFRSGFQDTDYLGANRRDQSWQIGTALSYDIYRNVSLSFDYEFARQVSNVAGLGYNRNVFMVGLSYRY